MSLSGLGRLFIRKTGVARLVPSERRRARRAGAAEAIYQCARDLSWDPTEGVQDGLSLEAAILRSRAVRQNARSARAATASLASDPHPSNRVADALQALERDLAHHELEIEALERLYDAVILFREHPQWDAYVRILLELDRHRDHPISVAEMVARRALPPSKVLNLEGSPTEWMRFVQMCVAAGCQFSEVYQELDHLTVPSYAPELHAELLGVISLYFHGLPVTAVLDMSGAASIHPAWSKQLNAMTPWSEANPQRYLPELAELLWDGFRPPRAENLEIRAAELLRSIQARAGEATPVASEDPPPF